MVELLQCDLDPSADDWKLLSQVFKATYDVLLTYTEGKSRKNAWYFAKYIDFFTSALGQKVHLYLCRTKGNKCTDVWRTRSFNNIGPL